MAEIDKIQVRQREDAESYLEGVAARGVALTSASPGADLVHIVECDACFFKTVGNGADGKIARVFFPAEALLGGSSDQFAVNEQGSRGVVPLRDAIFAIFQVGPMSFFERYGPLETANSKNDHRCNLQMAGIDVQQRCVFRMLGRINSVDLSLPDVFIYAATAASRLAGASTIRLPIA